MRVFCRVARLGSFSAAAREMRLSNTAVSRHVLQLETHLQVRLLHRPTRRCSLTEAGSAYLTRCERILADLEELEDALGEGQRSPKGRLRISAGISFAQEQLNALMPSFVTDHPDLDVELVLTDRHLDLIAEGIDVALRIGLLADSSHVARMLSPCRHVICASPDYVERHGALTHVDQLASRFCIIDTNQPSTWWFEGPDGETRVRPTGRYTVNSAHGACDAALAGLGVAYLPTFVAGPHLTQGTLLPQLLDHATLELKLYALFPENRYLSAGVRAFIDCLAQHFGPKPPWDTWREQDRSTAPDP